MAGYAEVPEAWLKSQIIEGYPDVLHTALGNKLALRRHMAAAIQGPGSQSSPTALLLDEALLLYEARLLI